MEQVDATPVEQPSAFAGQRHGTHQPPLVTDDLDARAFSADLVLDVLDQEAAAFHPLAGDPPLHVTGQLPGANLSRRLRSEAGRRR
ncbi:MAG TPA: hypothetical protein VJ827_11675 [Rubrobacter sp.]|nr:hypothetical protein [Rubrobacter sp.]